MPKTKVEIILIKTADGTNVEGKQCTGCSVVKPLEKFRAKKGGLGGKTAYCKICMREKFDSKYNDLPSRKERQRKYRKRHAEELMQKNKVWYENNKEYFKDYYSSEEQLEYRRNYYKNNKEYFAKWISIYRKNHPEIDSIKSIKRRTRKKMLPNSLTITEKREIIAFFNNECCLSSEQEIHMDHFIALSTGHGGTYKGNIVPMGACLNSSKSDMNPFEWIKQPEVQEVVDKDKWEKLITYLAKENGLTDDEFVEYVNWCYNNKRNDEEIIKDKRTSVEIWNKKV